MGKIRRAAGHGSFDARNVESFRQKMERRARKLSVYQRPSSLVVGEDNEGKRIF